MPVAVRGPAAVNGKLTDIGYRNVVDENGANFWSPTPQNDTRQSQFVLDGPFPWDRARRQVGEELERLLCRPPKDSSADG